MAGHSQTAVVQMEHQSHHLRPTIPCFKFQWWKVLMVAIWFVMMCSGAVLFMLEPQSVLLGPIIMALGLCLGVCTVSCYACYVFHKSQKDRFAINHVVLPPHPNSIAGALPTATPPREHSPPRYYHPVAQNFDRHTVVLQSPPYIQYSSSVVPIQPYGDRPPSYYEVMKSDCR